MLLISMVIQTAAAPPVFHKYEISTNYFSNQLKFEMEVDKIIT